VVVTGSVEVEAEGDAGEFARDVVDDASGDSFVVFAGYHGTRIDQRIA
jgi:hypothetical protein